MKWTLIVGIGIILLVLFGISVIFRGDPVIVGQVISEPEGGVEKSLSVNIVNYVYTPKDLEIVLGETVTWTNKDFVAHTITSVNGEFDSGEIERGERFSYTFNDVGEYEYYCTLHPYMRGKIIVK